MLTAQLNHFRELWRDLLLILQADKYIRVNEDLAAGHASPVCACVATRIGKTVEVRRRTVWVIQPARLVERGAYQTIARWRSRDRDRKSRPRNLLYASKQPPGVSAIDPALLDIGRPRSWRNQSKRGSGLSCRSGQACQA